MPFYTPNLKAPFAAPCALREERHFGLLLMRVRIVINILILACISVLCVDTSAHAAFSIRTEYLYDLQGPTKDSHLRSQNGILCDFQRNEIYVVDTGNRCVRIFGKEGVQIFEFGSNGELGIPLGVAINSLGDIYVLQGGFGGTQIDIFDFRGKYLSKLEPVGLPENETCDPTNIAIDSHDNIYISDQKHACIYAFDRDGQFRFKILPEMSEKDRGEVIFGNLRVGKDDSLYLPISTLGTVYMFDSQGQYVRDIGMQGGGPGKLAFPVDVVVDKNGRFLVLDKMRHCISVYDNEGRYLTEFGGMGRGPGWFYFPSALEIDRYGRIYVSQKLDDKVQVLKLKEESK